MEKGIYSNEAISISRVIKAVRKEKGLRQVEVAERLGCTQSYLSKIEQGELMIDAAVLMRLCRVMDISFSDLATRIDNDFDAHA